VPTWNNIVNYIRWSPEKVHVYPWQVRFKMSCQLFVFCVFGWMVDSFALNKEVNCFSVVGLLIRKYYMFGLQGSIFVIAVNWSLKNIDISAVFFFFIFDVHMTIYRVKFLTIKPTRCTNFSNLFLEWNSACFGRFLCPSSGVFHCTYSNGICHADSLRAGSGRNWVPSWPTS
jgi:hypothetical protein